MTGAEALTWADDRLAALPDVTRRAEFGNQTFLVGGTRFAALTGRAVVMHLPPAELIDALRRGIARPFVSAGAMGKNGWVELAVEGIEEPLLERYLLAAHSAAHQAHRRTAPRRPAGARRTRPTRSSPG